MAEKNTVAKTKENKKLEQLEGIVYALLKKAGLKVVWDGNKPLIEPDITPKTIKDEKRKKLIARIGL